eukprot:g11671.t1
MLVGAAVRGTVAIGDVDPWTLVSGDLLGSVSDEPQRWGEIMLRSMVKSEHHSGNMRIEATWSSMSTQVCETSPRKNADASSPEEYHSKTATARLVPAGFRKDAISLQEIDELPCSNTFFCCHDFFIFCTCCACCAWFGNERVENDWRVYVHGDRQPSLEAAEEKRLYQWVLVNGTLRSMSPLASDLEDLDLAQGGFRVQAVVKRFAAAKWVSLGWWVFLLTLFLVMAFALDADEDEEWVTIPLEDGGAFFISRSLFAGPPILVSWLAVLILTQVAHSAGLSFQKGLERLRREKNFLVGTGDLGSATIGPNGENAKNARKTGALISDVLNTGANTNTSKSKGGNTNVDEDRAMVSRIASRLGENRHHMAAEDKRIWDKNATCCSSLSKWLWGFPIFFTLLYFVAMAPWPRTR